MRHPPIVLSIALVLAAAVVPAATDENAAAEVERTERAFAATMAARDHAAFAAFVADDAVFMTGAETLRGKARVVEAWRPLYDGPDAPFSWEPARVEVLATGGLALSTGPVRDAAGTVVGEFTSIWRREPDGTWRIVFDRGNDVCRPAPVPEPEQPPQP